MRPLKLLSLLLLFALAVTSCRKNTPEPASPTDTRLARVISYNSSLGSANASEDQYEYNSMGQLVRLNMYYRGTNPAQLVLGRYETFAYDSTGRLKVKTGFSQLKGFPWYATVEWRYTYPTINKVVETNYSVFPANSPSGPGDPYMTSYSETLLEGGLVKERSYFTKDGTANGTYLYAYSNGKIQREEFRRDNVVANSTQYTYNGNTVKVESFMNGYPGSIAERRQTLDARGRVIRDEVITEANIYFERNMGPNIHIYEYLN